MLITIPGRPIPALRMTQGSRWTASAKRYLGYKTNIGYITLRQCKEPTEGKVSVWVRVYLSGSTTPMGNDGDVDNYLKSALDGLNKIAWLDDRQVVMATVSKEPCDRDKQRMDIEIIPISNSKPQQ